MKLPRISADEYIDRFALEFGLSRDAVESPQLRQEAP
jgi:hypothetical protein